jgi:hypothetical protein
MDVPLPQLQRVLLHTWHSCMCGVVHDLAGKGHDVLMQGMATLPEHTEAEAAAHTLQDNSSSGQDGSPSEVGPMFAWNVPNHGRGPGVGGHPQLPSYSKDCCGVLPPHPPRRCASPCVTL